MTDTIENTTDDTTDLQSIIDGYFACWNATDAAVRCAAVERHWAPEARSVDPMADVHGHEELTAMFAGFHETYASHSFRQRGGVDEHHDIVRWGWEMLNPDGEVVLDGIDAAMVADGKISYLVGFFGYDLPTI